MLFESRRQGQIGGEFTKCCGYLDASIDHVRTDVKARVHARPIDRADDGAMKLRWSFCGRGVSNACTTFAGGERLQAMVSKTRGRPFCLAFTSL